MSFLDRLESSPGAANRSGKMQAIFDDPAVSDDYKAELMVALLDKRFSAPQILKLLRQDGHDIGVTTLKEFRRGFIELAQSTTETSDE